MRNFVIVAFACRTINAALFAVVLAVGPGLTAAAAPSACPEHFFEGQSPDLLNPKLTAETTELCFSAFSAEHSGVTRTPLWVAEHLTAARILAARQLPRQGSFHAERSLPAGQGAQLSDYVRSGYDRGHMAPNGDMPTPMSQAESFSLANMIPQAPHLNRVLWEGIESSVRDWAVREGEVYVVTGPIYQGEQLQALQGRVLVPTLVFKAVYDPVQRRAGAYLTHNTDDSGYEEISIAQLTRMTGIDVFPSLSHSVKLRVADMPVPVSHYAKREQARSKREPSLLQSLVKALLGIDIR
jgi:endonuclease G